MRSAPLLLAFASAVVLVSAAQADDDKGQASRVPLHPRYQQECAACHVAYPPRLLPAESWQRLMTNLPRHFGTDASLDATTTRQLSDWLAAHAGERRAPPQDRITRSSWFLHEHDEVGASTWQRVSIKSPSNCAACHTRADQGDFNERFIRIPR
ncbi:MAG: diheme cytochrome c [Aquabacterium sp.]|uniref:diheme cytochrome c n=1 Tax=Aquabacterium sp. TaxID=1872578 RepID=UPI0025C39A63|nr:diheme cytochrome c [Aquabacterium sp.]MBI5926489.1 diheme cytochrome c [Aquabacterium sp.]